MILVVTELFNGYIKKVFQKKEPDLYKALMADSRKNKAIEMVCNQVRVAELSLVHKGGFTKQQLKEIVEAGADMYCRLNIKHKEENIMSKVEQNRLIQQANELSELQAELDQDEKDYFDSLTTTKIYMND